MIKREAKFGQLFRAWLKANPMRNAAFELKQTTGVSLPFSDVQEHQIMALRAVKERGGKGLLYKIPDDSRGIKPFDFVYLREAGAFIVIRFPKEFHIIDVDTFEACRAKCGRKSITSPMAREISIATIKL